MIRVMRNPVFCICDNKSIQIICTASVQLISAFVFATWLLQFLYFLHLKYQVPSDLLGLHSRFVLGLIRNPEDRFSRDEAHIKPFHEILYEPRYEKTGFLHMRKQRHRSATWIVQSFFYLNPKFQASSHLLWLYSLVCVRPGRKPRRPVFSERGSYCIYILYTCISGG